MALCNVCSANGNPARTYWKKAAASATVVLAFSRLDRTGREKVSRRWLGFESQSVGSTNLILIYIRTWQVVNLGPCSDDEHDGVQPQAEHEEDNDHVLDGDL